MFAGKSNKASNVILDTRVKDDPCYVFYLFFLQILYKCGSSARWHDSGFYHTPQSLYAYSKLFLGKRPDKTDYWDAVLEIS